MARTAVKDRRSQIGQAALKAFSEAGFRRTQVADIAKLAGTAPGTLYLYAESKEALFVMALEVALGVESSTTPPTDFLETIATRITSNRSYSSLAAFREDPTKPPPEPSVIFAEIWDAGEKLAPVIRLVERCAADWPDLAKLFYETLRPRLINSLTFYFERAAEAGIVRNVPYPELAARLVVETTAWFTMHRLGDPDGQFFEASKARHATLDALVNAYASYPRGIES